LKSHLEGASGLRRFVPRSIVARTSLSILLLAVAMGLIFSVMASWRVQAAEHGRLMARVDELAATVERTVSIACFLNDRQLAKEIAMGLMKNRIIAGVRITAGTVALFDGGVGKPAAGSKDVDALSRPIYSPFDERAAVGAITLYVSHAEIRAQAAAYSRYTIWVLSLQVSIVAGAVAFLVYLLVTRPIKGISDELHQLEVKSGMRLTLPSAQRTDEIGQLVLDVNVLIARLTDLLGTERELRIAHEMSERRMRLVLEKADTGILVLDDAGVVQSCNPAFVRILGPAAAATGARLDQLLAPHGELIAELIGSSRESGEPRDADLEIEVGARGKIWVELSVNPLGPNLLQGLVNDITERKRAEVAAHELASRDTVTGLLNRRGVDAMLAKHVGPARHEAHSSLALLQIDLDRFKAVNDSYGHEAGDRVLREVARVLERSVRRSDVVGRLGGDEFVVLLPGIGELEKAVEIANNIIAGISQPIDIGQPERACVGASVGVALARDSRETPEALLRRADAAMYMAKQSGRGRAQIAPMPPEEPRETAAA
jgi:diguanylate cyclase (GGDEF)-like protein/PAS domain S-box-containing protein